MESREKWFWPERGLFFARTLWFFIGFIYFYTDQDLKHIPALPLLLSHTACYIIPALFWRPGYRNLSLFFATELLTTGVFNWYLSDYLQQNVGIIIFPTMIAGFLSTGRIWMVTAPLYTGAYILSRLAVENMSMATALTGAFDSLMMFGIGYVLQRVTSSNRKMKQLLLENEYQYKLIQDQNNTLEQYTEKVEQLTLIEERNRMARELHDTIGHTFTSVIMGMDAVGLLIDSDPQLAKRKLETLRDVTYRGLDEIRESIHGMDTNEGDSQLSMLFSRLISEFSLHTGTNTKLYPSGVEYDISRPVKLTLIRCLQESLTNAKRHGAASSIDVSLVFEDGQILLQIEDNGIGFDAISPGFGLKVMRERITALNGSLLVDSAKGKGTIVSCKVPTGGQFHEKHITAHSG
ncbi:sensor histidine kinase [Fictibacillus aquaticus]|nr:sensor histidine kinase [Fictibacillus aquaticus]